MRKDKNDVFNKNGFDNKLFKWLQIESVLLNLWTINFKQHFWKFFVANSEGLIIKDEVYEE